MMRSKFADPEREAGFLHTFLTSERKYQVYWQPRIRSDLFQDELGQLAIESGLALLNRNLTAGYASVLDQVFLQKGALVHEGMERYLNGVSQVAQRLAFAMDDTESVPFDDEVDEESPVQNRVLEDLHYLEHLRQNRVLEERIVLQTQKLMNNNVEPGKIVEAITKALQGIVTSRGTRTIAQAADDALEAILYYQDHRPPVLETGISSLDAAMPLRINRMITLAAKPSVGKSLAMFDIIIRVFRHNDKAAVLCFSLEIPELDFMFSLYCNMAGIDSQRLEGSINPNIIKLTAEEKERLRRARDEVKTWDLKIIDYGCTYEDIRLESLLFLHDRTDKHCLIALDHHLKWQAVSGSENIRQTIIAGSNVLYMLKKHHQCTVLLLAQQNMAVPDTDKDSNPIRPYIWIQESASVEQDSDTVAVLWRPDRDKEELLEEQEMIFCIEKQRRGQAKIDVHVRCVPKYGQLLDEKEDKVVKMPVTRPDEWFNDPMFNDPTLQNGKAYGFN